MSDRIRRGACPTTQKVCYNDRATAKHHIRRANMAGVTSFKCNDCGFFHIGGWHGAKDRAAHRGEEMESETMPIGNACRALEVSPEFIGRLIDAGKVRSRNGLPFSADIDRLAAK